MKGSESHVPSLRTLIVFEAVARLSSTRLAAEACGVSYSSVIRHVRSLERMLGAPLFRRSGHRLVLNENGEEYFSSVRLSLAHLQAAGARLRDRRC